MLPNRLQIARRLVQLLVVVLILGIPVLARYNYYLIENKLDASLQRWQGSFEGVLLGALDRTVRLAPGTERETPLGVVRDKQGILRYTQQFKGGPWSAEIFGLSLTDPLAGLESILASGRVSRSLLISLLIPVVVALLLGRVFCSWICPAGLLLEFTDKLRAGLVRLGFRPLDIRFARSTKYLVLAVGLVVTALFGMSALGLLYPPAVVGREAHDLVSGMFDRAEGARLRPWTAGLTWMSLFMGAIVGFELTLSQRSWCRYFCPGGALYSLLGRFRLVRVYRRAASCNQCGVCASVCPMGLLPIKDRLGLECDNCGLCISSCESHALGYDRQRHLATGSPELVQVGASQPAGVAEQEPTGILKSSGS